MDKWSGFGQFVLAIAVLLIAVGRWGGRLEAARRASASPRENQAQQPQPQGRSEHEILAERLSDLTTRVDRYEQQNQRDHDGIRRDYKSNDDAITRRIDTLMGQN